MLKSKEEFARAMLDGKKFNLRGFVCSFKPEYQEPFRIGATRIRDSWELYEQAEEIIEWYHDIPPQGILCRVWGGVYYKENNMVRIVNSCDNIKMFNTDKGSWSNAEPLTKEEAMEYIYETQ